MRPHHEGRRPVVTSWPVAGWGIFAALGGLLCLVTPPFLTHSGPANPGYGYPLIPWFAIAFANLAFTHTFVCMSVLGAVLGYAQPRSWLIAGCLTVSLPFFMHAVNVVHDWTIDATSHNLFPFEFLILSLFGIPAVVGALAGSFLGAWSRERRH